MNEKYVEDSMHYCIVASIAKEMNERGIITQRESVQIAKNYVKKSSKTPCKSPHCGIRTGTTK